MILGNAADLSAGHAANHRSDRTADNRTAYGAGSRAGNNARSLLCINSKRSG
ncbi:hypothetical protein GCM10017653_48860 [Ancylobacter defluvii]|uniref:Uncharacterized protein n=1 Tax=Ancylobacter defluvii TaxID=1282440 RepID=A0A9W6NDR2_9HYPH|nr:hypothetical protein GCM10017653_48860 [Ancylobacter defluvii]